MQRWWSKMETWEPSPAPSSIRAATYKKKNESLKKKLKNQSQPGQPFPFEAEIFQHSFQFQFTLDTQRWFYFFYSVSHKVTRVHITFVFIEIHAWYTLKLYLCKRDAVAPKSEKEGWQSRARALKVNDRSVHIQQEKNHIRNITARETIAQLFIF